MAQVIRDSVVGKTQAAGRVPSTEGIASARIANKRAVTEAVKRGMDCAQTLNTLFDAAYSDDPALVEIGERLLGNPEFLRAMVGALEKILAEVKAAKAAKPAAAPVAPKVFDPTAPGTTQEDIERAGAEKSTRGSGLPGTDSAVDRYFKGQSQATGLDEYFNDPGGTGLDEYFKPVVNEGPAPVNGAAARTGGAPSIVRAEDITAARNAPTE